MNQSKPRVTWDDDGWAVNEGWASAHCTNNLTGEYSGLYDVWVSAGTGLPSGAYLEAPPTPEQGKAIVRTAEGWALLADHRGAKAYHKQTREPTVISEIGELPTNLTLRQPYSPFDTWDEHSGTWVRDDNAEQQAALAIAQQEQALRLTNASQQIAIIKPAVDGGYAKPSHTQLLADWQRCRYELTLVPEKPGWPEKPQWPAEPDKVI